MKRARKLEAVSPGNPITLPARFATDENYVTGGGTLMSATGTPSAPCLRINAFWASENLDAFIALRSSQPGNRCGRL